MFTFCIVRNALYSVTLSLEDNAICKCIVSYILRVCYKRKSGNTIAVSLSYQVDHELVYMAKHACHVS